VSLIGLKFQSDLSLKEQELEQRSLEFRDKMEETNKNFKERMEICDKLQTELDKVCLR
jgi:aminopeptidase C